MNQGKGKYVQRKPYGFVYGRHEHWTKANDPLNFKVDRSPEAIARAKNPQKAEI